MPPGRANDQWHASANGALSVFRNGIGNRKIDRDIARFQNLYQVFNLATGIIDIDRQRDLMAFFTRELTHQTAHCAISEQSELHKLFTKST
jgi:hypothetical protein